MGASAAHEIISLVFSVYPKPYKKELQRVGSQEQVLEMADCKTQKFSSVQAASKQKVPKTLFVSS